MLVFPRGGSNHIFETYFVEIKQDTQEFTVFSYGLLSGKGLFDGKVNLRSETLLSRMYLQTIDFRVPAKVSNTQ